MEILTSRTIVRPTDLDRSLAFYRDGLGLAVAREFGSGSARGVVFFAGGGLIEVVGERLPGHGALDGVALWLQVRSVDDVVSMLESHQVAVARGPQLEPWGLIEAWIDDPDGLRIHLVEVPVDHPLRRDNRST
jgi:catechol 2,3-dioxygenase-like lactoylglutathione lyase family enzyme